MPEIIIKYKNQEALKTLKKVVKEFELSMEKVEGSILKKRDSESDNKLPVTFSKNTDVIALAGIWEGKNITLEGIRKESWRNNN